VNGYTLNFVSGSQMGAPSYITLSSSVSPGSEVNISVPFTAPTTPGTYRSDWRMNNASRVFFGDQVYVQIFVDSPSVVNKFLSFPLPNRDQNSVKINAVFDHSMNNTYRADNKVVSYTDEIGEKQYGSSFVVFMNSDSLFGFKKSGGGNFSINGNYVGGGAPNYLYYDGHPGYDFRTIDIGTNVPVLAVADGIAYIGSDAVGEVYIDHGNGYRTNYIHLVNSSRITNGTTVTKGQQIGIAGNTGTAGVHLHFEVRKNVSGQWRTVDPYGWQGIGTDPYYDYTGITNIILWKETGGTGTNPSNLEISDYANNLSLLYKVPSVIIKAVLEQESDWRQFDSNGNPLIREESGERISIGLMQILVNNINFVTLPLGKITEGIPQGSNSFTTTYENIQVDVNRLKTDWRYNLEIGVRFLVYNKVYSGGAGDDARILENWYYPLAYYNGAVQGGANDPGLSSYSRIAPSNIDWRNKNKFPYQECIYNIIAQLYTIPIERRSYFGSAIKVTLPGPAAASTGSGNYSIVDPVFCFWDWATYFSNGNVQIGKCGTSQGCWATCTTKTGINVNVVNFGTPVGITHEIKIPEDFLLSQNYPNPFNPSTKIKFALPEKANVKLSIYNLLGEKVAELVDGEMDAGYHETQWHANGFASGVYFYRLQASPSVSSPKGQAGQVFVETKKLILMK